MLIFYFFYLREVYHWSELWRSLLSFIRFLTTYSSTLRSLPQLDSLSDLVVNVIGLSLSVGDTFLPGPADYDDLFYKIVETGEILTKFRHVCTCFFFFLNLLLLCMCVYVCSNARN